MTTDVMIERAHLHDETGARVAAIRRGSDGTWIAERQNSVAHASDTAIRRAESDG